jgi:hypothetical protein
LKPPRRFTVLDVGAASGDNGRAIRAIWPAPRLRRLILRITIYRQRMADGGGRRLSSARRGTWDRLRVLFVISSITSPMTT